MAIAFLGSSKPASITLKNNLAASGGALGGSDHLYMLICFVSQRGCVKWTCFDDFTMSVLHLSSYSNRARHELYIISLGLSVAQFVDFPSLYLKITFRWG